MVSLGIIHKVRTGKIRIFDTSLFHRTGTYEFKYPSYPTVRTKIIFFNFFHISKKFLILYVNETCVTNSTTVHVKAHLPHLTHSLLKKQKTNGFQPNGF